MKFDKENAKVSIIKAWKGVWSAIPILMGVILLIGAAKVFVPSSFYASMFKGNLFTNSVIGSAIGSILAGNPVTSYVIGGELLKQGINLIPVTAFLVAWVTVGLVQLPAESMLLGKRFAISRNVSAFAFSIVVAFVTVFVVNLI